MKSSGKGIRVRLNLKERIIVVLNRILTIRDSPERIAKGFALGTFIGMTPFIGFQLFIAVFIARLLSWNKLAAGIAVFQTNVLTGTFVFGFNFMLGAQVLGLEQTINLFENPDLLSFSTIFGSGTSILLAFIIGGVITGVPSALLAFHLIKRWLNKRQNKYNPLNTES
ncbi:DUF2062 domain-containing protein [Mangrovibacterium lignilyticum]|uniref:DUF2062 domain-containing protein n=1 Tax=Mangrovibacterium lignilyticum TaxID=2668052 RepID=UPI0013D37C52|nr:DUF2062 domain-containing protein [Mangrovibacterium lignilyticum]